MTSDAQSRKLGQVRALEVDMFSEFVHKPTCVHAGMSNDN